MPIYEFGCEKCGREFEELISTENMPPCPYCGATSTKKLMSCCARHKGRGTSSEDYSAPSGGGGCAGCSGGNCASCCH